MLTKKSELAGKIRKRIEDSEKRKIEITEESVANDEIGSKLEDALGDFAPEVELEKYRGHVDEVEKVQSLSDILKTILAGILHNLSFQR